jgi:BirA family biotin operon repressor/biotin-[acetyl-CoA-carboxylase] ligase
MERAFQPADLDRIQDESPVRVVEYYRQLSSTSDRALQLARVKECETPLVVLAELQTAGRGRGSNRWWAGPGALTFSLVIDLKNGQRSVGDTRVSLATALAVRDALSTFDSTARFQLKWPNDIFLQSRKIAGILLERPALHLNRLVVGIGVNVNNSLQGAPATLQETSNSFCDATGRHLSLPDLLITTLNSLVEQYAALAEGQLPLLDRWNAHCILRGQAVNVESGKRQMTGVCRGVDPEGALVVQTDAGLETFASGSVRKIRPGCSDSPGQFR